ncbi:DUF484 family protein [Comamonas sp. Y33R10-2]|uniref:DUF484 family protein n=1 Tax=Comamonas sp. Y33R10-2 TaxID=2853257 RepID=UPI001C5CAD89|nr:DUF484 family protein [Comamonas sp. Y33R10-2]QXZ09363.1 DUF484 family protein [Comamonas sp. Y33R10-2]
MNSLTDIAITEESIADYLQHNPEFFERNAQMLANVRLVSGHGPRAVSLQERQAEMLREKLKGLEHRIMDMVRHGSENASIANKIHQWTHALVKVQDLRELPHALTASLQHIFDVPQVALRLWNVAGAHSGTVYTMGVSEDAKTFASSLTMPFCGPNMGFEAANWLHQPHTVQSMAMLTLHDGAMDSTSNVFGMLVLGSPDPTRFDATMGLEFLSRISELASASLSRMRLPALTLAHG